MAVVEEMSVMLQILAVWHSNLERHWVLVVLYPAAELAAAAAAASSSGAKLWTGPAPYFPSHPEEQLQSLDVRLQVEDQEILHTCSDSPIL
jgi:hypothetical protein